AHDLGPAPDGGGDEAVVDDQQPQVLALDHLLDEHGFVDAARAVDRRPQLVERPDAHRDAPALLAARRLDDHAAMLAEEAALTRRVAGRHLLRYVHARCRDNAARHRLVIADGHGDRRRQVGQAFATPDAAPAVAEAEHAAGRVDQVDLDASPHGLVDDDAGVGIELVARPAARIEALVERI